MAESPTAYSYLEAGVPRHPRRRRPAAAPSHSPTTGSKWRPSSMNTAKAIRARPPSTNSRIRAPSFATPSMPPEHHGQFARQGAELRAVVRGLVLEFGRDQDVLIHAADHKVGTACRPRRLLPRTRTPGSAAAARPHFPRTAPRPPECPGPLPVPHSPLVRCRRGRTPSLATHHKLSTSIDLFTPPGLRTSRA
jgi:hypothetical protein